MSNINVKPINILTYLADFDGILPALAGYYAGRMAFKENNHILGAYIEGVPSGAAFTEVDGRLMTIVYSAVSETHRRMGVFSELIGACMDRAEESGMKSVWINYAPVAWASSSHSERPAPHKPEGDFIDLYLIKRGFHRRETSVTVIVRLTDTSKAEWNAFLQNRANTALHKLSAKGFTAVSFADISSETMEKLHSLIGTEFPNNLDLRKCPNEILTGHSFVTLHKVRPAAYCIISSADGGRTAVVEYMASAVSYMNKGAFLPCFVAAVDSLARNNDCSKIAYTYVNGNGHMNRLADRALKFTDACERKQSVYRYDLPK